MQFLGVAILIIGLVAVWGALRPAFLEPVWMADQAAAVAF